MDNQKGEMMKRLSGIIVGCTLGLITTASVAVAEVQYMDDRSSPEKLVQSFYNAINQKQYTRAFSYFYESFAPKDYDSWMQGYAETVSVSVQFGSTQPDPGAGQVYWALPVAISSLSSDGSTQVFAGCYTLHLTAPEMQTNPPFVPMSISGAKLSKSDKPVQDAVPTSCAS